MPLGSLKTQRTSRDPNALNLLDTLKIFSGSQKFFVVRLLQIPVLIAYPGERPTQPFKVFGNQKMTITP